MFYIGRFQLINLHIYCCVREREGETQREGERERERKRKRDGEVERDKKSIIDVVYGWLTSEGLALIMVKVLFLLFAGNISINDRYPQPCTLFRSHILTT